MRIHPRLFLLSGYSQRREKKGTKKAMDRVRSMSFALKDRLQRARLHSVQYHSFFFFFINSEKAKKGEEEEEKVIIIIFFFF
jgi:hypothetical protein